MYRKGRERGGIQREPRRVKRWGLRWGPSVRRGNLALAHTCGGKAVTKQGVNWSGRTREKDHRWVVQRTLIIRGISPKLSLIRSIFLTGAETGELAAQGPESTDADKTQTSCVSEPTIATFCARSRSQYLVISAWMELQRLCNQ